MTLDAHQTDARDDAARTGAVVSREVAAEAVDQSERRRAAFRESKRRLRQALKEAGYVPVSTNVHKDLKARLEALCGDDTLQDTVARVLELGCSTMETMNNLGVSAAHKATAPRTEDHETEGETGTEKKSGERRQAA